MRLIKKKRLKSFVTVICPSMIAIYVLSFFCITFFKPNFINTKEGPIPVYQKFYLPLRYCNSIKPSYFWATASGLKSIEVTVDWINDGNGYTYFTWEEQERRAVTFYDTTQVKPGDTVYIDLEYRVETWDDFVDRLRPYITDTHKK